eukprot:CAMPEP_0175853478 /NCGR_PEP_ID=MMETSP0107_2-20121207/26821_1 /TAXON_ID=195067 ORGANISM="Goniomonas pacifica, Strain CCMP1869" /NCGR_SAMPLE_ID=MMETSP0107_2 /ASSEMBLY_ACC=CAM_ASM_000203 /LENGTH=80 /DNA_ID=CAMNT_0017169189 /DNA_START=295 /DNA_END=537 /DNA_ORIENTATION=+
MSFKNMLAPRNASVACRTSHLAARKPCCSLPLGFDEQSGVPPSTMSQTTLLQTLTVLLEDSSFESQAGECEHCSPIRPPL